jgi:ABC-type nickel/cobalt efflux system permease component RcnA
MFLKRLCSFLIAICLLCAARAFAHPMGNFSVNHYANISLERDGVRVTYIIDLAEIPTYQELQQGSVTADVADPAVTRFVAARGADFGRGLSLMLDGQRVDLHLLSSQVIFPPGAGGLPTMKMGFVYQANYPPAGDRSAARMEYADNNFPGHAGWKEIVAIAPAGMLISSSAPATDRSAELTNYPTDLLNSPPQDLSASIQFRLPSIETAGPSTTLRSGRDDNSASLSMTRDDNLLRDRKVVPATKLSSRTERGRISSCPALTSNNLCGSPQKEPHESPRSHSSLQEIRGSAVEGPAVSSGRSTGAASLHLQANQQATPRSAFTELITARSMNLWFLITAAFIALGLGALHALEPGHGKTIVAAYLVGSRGTARHAFLLGLIVTVSHTAGVFALGAITLYASRYIVPEQLYPWLGVFSGLTIAVLGGYMFLRRWSGLDLDHSHASGQLHGHWFSSSKQVSVSAPQPIETARSVSLYQLFALGITGGIIPCPAALVVLLSAFALHRIGLGFFLIFAFSLGLAAVLIAFGMLMVYGRRFMARLAVDGSLTTRWLPVASAAFMTILGAAIALRAFVTTGIGLHNLSKEKLGPVLFVAGLGLLLGMRHSTDPDHVVAVSTIVSKQRSIRQAGLIGTIWGLGHTLTIFAVGSMIILFGVVIPPRLGLSMEFSVALMLILLGVLNLTGLMQRVTSFLTPKGDLPAATTISSRAETLLERSVGRFGVYQCVRPLVIGIVHGLAGSAAVALLVLSTIHSPLWATVYLLIFGAGTMVGMMCMTAAMAVPLAFAGNRFTSLSRVFSVASGIVSVCFGFFLVYQLGFLGGLFTSHPQWTPR